MLKILDKIVYIVSLIAAFGLIGAYLSPIINPNTFVFFSLLGLAYPYLLIGNFILLLYWIAWLLVKTYLSAAAKFLPWKSKEKAAYFPRNRGQ